MQATEAMPRVPFRILLLALSCTMVDCGGLPSSPAAPGSATTGTTGPGPDGPAPPAPAAAGWDIETLGVPQFITASYIDLAEIGRITYFRSSHGHSYTDAFETCRSMKHYFIPRDYQNAASIRIFSPVHGRIQRVDQEWAGVQLRIEPDGYADWAVILFHVKLDSSLGAGSIVGAGEQIGTHIGSQTASDIALSVNTTAGFALVSPFHAMTPAALEPFQARGLGSSADAVITRAQRDAAPVTCSGDAFTGSDSLPVFTPFQ